eukprot:CAMPEP_0197259644 /NCGR_PEP_ID=MMETSP1429-20130617/83619_1 /TAXON_ID=49237 /ORGANISM="Chaetoceros  sp., Strain UNC1202" /LENGTH=101 /DNA_ID=CAMNT_0042723855 /DNA_START=336 /DNA_END=641 /DNA_ORIENTATION=+
MRKSDHDPHLVLRRVDLTKIKSKKPNRKVENKIKSTYQNHNMVHPDKNDKKNQIPESKTEEGSSRRNIMRKSDHDPHRKEKKQGGGGGGKGKWDPVDDGTL